MRRDMDGRLSLESSDSARHKGPGWGEDRTRKWQRLAFRVVYISIIGGEIDIASI